MREASARLRCGAQRPAVFLRRGVADLRGRNLRSGRRDAPLLTAAAAARAAGRPYDARRIDLFVALHADLAKQAPVPRPDPARAGEDSLLPFFDAYFSNFIEGTEFEVDEVRAIVFEGRLPQERPEDAHSYLTGLKALSQNGRTQTLIRLLDFLQKYTLAIDFATYEGARAQLETTHAFLDGGVNVELEVERGALTFDEVEPGKRAQGRFDLAPRSTRSRRW